MAYIHAAANTTTSTTIISTTAPPLSFSSLSDSQVSHAFDFLPLIQHTAKQIHHASTQSQHQAEDARAVHAATSALVKKLTMARDLLQLLPNIDVSQQEQMQESERLDQLIARKKAIIAQYRVAATQANASNSSEEKKDGSSMEI